MTRTRATAAGFVGFTVLTAVLLFTLLHRRPGIPPGQNVDLRALLAQRRPVEGQPLDKDWVDQVRALSAAATVDGPIAPYIALAMGIDLLDEEEPNFTGWVTDVDGDGSFDVVLKQSWSGTGSAFDLLVCLVRQPTPLCFTFRGSERGGTYYSQGTHIPVQEHLLDLRDGGRRLLAIPECLVDRGADTVINWPTLYSLQQDRYVIVDRKFRSFYENRVLPKLPTGKENPQAGDVRAVRELVGQLYP